MSGILNVMVAGRGAFPSFSNRSLSDTGGTPGIEIRFGTDGTLSTFRGAGVTSDTHLPEWAGIPVAWPGIGSQFEVRLTVNSGSSPHSAGNVSGVWYRITSNVRYMLFGPINDGSVSGSWLIEVRRFGDTTVLDSATYTVSVTTTGNPALPTPHLSNRSFNLGSDAATVDLRLIFRRYGTLETKVNDVTVTELLPEWHGDNNPANGENEGVSYEVAADHEIRFVKISGNMPCFNDDAIGSTALNANEWHTLDRAASEASLTNVIRYGAQAAAHGSGVFTGVFRVDIRRTSDNTIITQATYTVTGTIT